MPRYHRDEIAKLDDIEALLMTARDLADRFKCPKLSGAAGSIRASLATLRIAKSELIDDWRASDDER
jgi:hypothetical protein